MSTILNQIQPSGATIRKRGRPAKYIKETNCFGFDIHVGRRFTKGDYFDLVFRLGLNLGAPMDVSNVNEGGIQFAALPAPQYKCIRHHVFKSEDHRGTRVFPWITDAGIASWHNNTEVLWEAGYDGWTHLKAMKRAPVWTPEEVQTCMRVFSEFGFKCGQPENSKRLISKKLIDFI